MLLKSKITAGFHRNTYSYQFTLITDQQFYFCFVQANRGTDAGG